MFRIFRQHNIYRKIIIAALLAAVLVISAACGSTASENAADGQSEESSAAAVTEDQSEAGIESTAAEQIEEKRILVIETTDIHGWLVDASSGDPDTFQYRLAYIAQDINEARASGEYDDVLLLDGGDIYQGPPVSNLTYGASLKAALDYMDYDAVCLGNHEFDWDVVSCCADGDGTIASYELGEYKGDPDIPVLASNLYDAESGERVTFTRDYVVVEKAGRRIAVIGYIPDYSQSIMSSKIAPYTINDSLEDLNELVKRVNADEEPDMTVVLAHAEPVPVAEALDAEDVDLVLGGHSHQVKAGTASNGIPYLQGNCKAQGYASAVMVIGSDGNVTAEDIRYTDIKVDKQLLYDTEENLGNFDETVLDISYLAWNTVWEDMSEVLGYIDTTVKKENAVGAGSAGNWLTGIMLRATEEYGTVAAFLNNGGIRTSLSIPKGEYIRQVTVYDIYSIMPFDNRIMIYDITGAELAQLLENGLKDTDHGDQMSGLTFTYSATGDDTMDRWDREYTILSITLDDGTEVDPTDNEKLYRVCIPNYSATLEGSVFENKTPLFSEADAPVDHDLIIEQLRKERDAGDGYIPVDTSARGTEQ